MCKIPWLLVDDGLLPEEEATTVCKAFREHAPKRPSLQKVLSLEREARAAERLPPLKPKIIPEIPKPPAVEEKRVKKPIIEITEPQISSDDYEHPFVRVRNIAGELLRYEDAKGKIVPNLLWPNQRR